MPLPISPLINPHTGELIRIDFLPTGKDNTVNKNPGPWKPRLANEYIPEGQTKIRDDLKPLNVIQPEGASFKVSEQGTSQVIQWQKWSFRVGFNAREGMVLYNVLFIEDLSRQTYLLTSSGLLRQSPTILSHRAL